jgi:hypothetical protein
MPTRERLPRLRARHDVGVWCRRLSAAASRHTRTAQADASNKNAPTWRKERTIGRPRKEAQMALALPLAFTVFGYGLIGVLVIVALIVLIVRML